MADFDDTYRQQRLRQLKEKSKSLRSRLWRKLLNRQTLRSLIFLGLGIYRFIRFLRGVFELFK